MKNKLHVPTMQKGHKLMKKIRPKPCNNKNVPQRVE